MHGYRAGLSADELNNIDIYKQARSATVNISSTVYRRGWFSELIPSRETGSGFVIDKADATLGSVSATRYWAPCFAILIAALYWVIS